MEKYSYHFVSLQSQTFVDFISLGDRHKLAHSCETEHNQSELYKGIF